MPDKEKAILQNIVETIPKLSEGKQNYILGVAEGMVLANEDKAKDKKAKQE